MPRPTARLAALGVVAALVALAAVAPPAAAADVKLNGFALNDARPGDLVQVRGTGYPAGAAVMLTMDGAPLDVSPAGATVPANGTVLVSFQVPARPSKGNTPYAVVLAAGGTSARGDLLLRPTVSPRSAPAVSGDVLEVAALGFQANSLLTITYGGNRVTVEPATVTTDSAGTATFKFTVPESRYGSHSLLVNDLATNSAAFVVNVGPQIKLESAVAPAGSTVAFSGNGFHPDSFVTVSIVKPGGATEALRTIPTSPTPNSNGAWSRFQAQLVPLAAGTYKLRAADTSGAVAEADLTVVPALSASAPSGLPGDRVTLTSGGWPAGASVRVRLDGATLATTPTPLVAAANGSVPRATFEVPAMPAGTYTLEADAAGGAKASTAFTVRARPVAPGATPPAASRHLTSPEAPDGRDGWYVTVPTVVLFGGATDVLRYRLDDEAWREYRAPITIPAGSSTLAYYATSASGVEETPKTLSFRVDADPPLIEQVLVEGRGATRALSVLAQDGLSGVASADFLVEWEGGSRTLTAVLGDGGAWRAEFSPPVAGQFRLTARATDVAGSSTSRGGYLFDVTAADVAADDGTPDAGAPPAPGRESPAPGALLALAAAGVGLVLARRGRPPAI